MEDCGLVSIISPTYNCGNFISETIESVLAQTYSNWEMLIVDDCSTDDTEKIVSEYSAKDSRIKYFRFDKNQGAAMARNHALREAKGRWIAFLDSDDLWEKNKLDTQLKFMEENGYSFSYHKYDEIGEQGEKLGITVSGKKKVGRFGMFSCCWPGCLAVMYDADKIGLIQIVNIAKNNDMAMWLKVIKKSPCYYNDEMLGHYRRRKGSITSHSTYVKIKYHYKLYRQSEEMNPIQALFYTGLSLCGSLYKKLFFVKRQ